MKIFVNLWSICRKEVSNDTVNKVRVFLLMRRCVGKVKMFYLINRVKTNGRKTEKNHAVTQGCQTYEPWDKSDLQEAPVHPVKLPNISLYFASENNN